MEAARRLRLIDSDVCLAFITSLSQYAIQGYRVNAVDYIVKPVQYEPFRTKMTRIMRFLRKNEEPAIIIATADGRKVVHSSELRYVEVHNHDVVLHLTDGDAHVSGSLSKMEERLKSLGLVRISTRCMVNHRFVAMIGSTSIELDDGELLHMSRAGRGAMKSELARLMGGSV